MLSRLYLLFYVWLALSQASEVGIPLVLTADLGTESCRVGLWDAKGNLISTSSAPYVTTYPRPGWAEQAPEDWWVSFQKASRDALSKPGVDPKSVCAICIDTTACSVVALDAEMRPLRNCLLWCDSRSSKQCDEILAKGKGDPALRVNCDGKGPISAEWMIPKALWLKQEEPETWAAAAYICEKQDFINWKLTGGELVASGCNTAARWHFSGADPPRSLLEKLNLSDLLGKWPKKMVPMGALVGALSRESASALGGLPETGIPVVQGGPDAYVGMLGLGVLEPKRMALITGSSHLHLCVSEISLSGSGFWGAYKDAPMAGLCFAEGGQSSTGSLLQWAKKLMGGGSPSDNNAVSFATLDAEAEKVPPGADGLVCLETFQGSRTPETDPRARGALVGLSLFHSRGHVWRSLLEGICLGTRHCISALQKAGLGADELVVGGGATRSPFFLAMHADVTGLPVVITEQDNAPLLGCAVLAAAGAGLFPLAQVPGGAQNQEEDTILAGVRRAAASMVRVSRRILPNAANTHKYDALFRVYRGMGGLLRESIHSLQAPPESAEDATVPAVPSEGTRGRQELTVVPSLLASDHGYLAQEASMCLELGATWVHIDVCDGGETAQGSLTVGPQAVAAIVRGAPGLMADVHLVANRPGAYIQAMAEAGVTRLTLQWEQLAVPEVEAVGPHAVVAVITAVSRRVRDSGMACGLCLAPDTPVEVLLPLADLLSGPAPVIEFIDILAVKPGVGGQAFGSSALQKVSFLRKRFPFLNIGIDGGVSDETIARAVNAGANFLIAGTAIFGTERRRIQDGDGGVRARLGRLRKLAVAAVAADGSKASMG